MRFQLVDGWSIDQVAALYQVHRSTAARWGEMLPAFRCRMEFARQSQLLTYLKLARIPTGLLINFNLLLLKDGLKRFVV